MSDKMRTIPFKELLMQSVEEYKKSESLFGVVVDKNVNDSPLGPAAGPHTQLSQNLIAAYAAGARHFELKTVQILSGEALNIGKPCIYVEQEAYNTEWSSELTAKEAAEEYIKAWFILHILAKEFQLPGIQHIKFYMSVGYDYEGITSSCIDEFIEMMKDASQTAIWKECKSVVKEQLKDFDFVTKEFLEDIPYTVSDTLVISTMHGCPADEIEKIAFHLLHNKQLHVYIKCNPTLLGYEKSLEILKHTGFDEIELERETFEHDITFDTLVTILKSLKIEASQQKLTFGIKLTNTFPVKCNNEKLSGDMMYMSGPALFPFSIHVAYMLAREFDGSLPISYCGGVDSNNVVDIARTGMYPITVCTLLLKQGGYKNITKLQNILISQNYLNPISEKDLRNHSENISMENKKTLVQVEKLKELADTAVSNEDYHRKKKGAKQAGDINKNYSRYCAVCNNCVDVCPNRANVRVEFSETDDKLNITTDMLGKRAIIHLDGRCNECGNCSDFCVMNKKPYLDKFTLFETLEDYKNSNNNGIYQDEHKKYIRMN